MTAYSGFLALWPWFALAAFVCLAALVHESRERAKADRARAAKVAHQERADVAGRKANAEAVVWR